MSRRKKAKLLKSGAGIAMLAACLPVAGLSASPSPPTGGTAPAGAPGRSLFGESSRDHAASENLDQDPLFRDPERFDFRLRAGSPAIAAAPPNAAVPADLEGNPRPADGRQDLGAYEYRP